MSQKKEQRNFDCLYLFIEERYLCEKYAIAKNYAVLITYKIHGPVFTQIHRTCFQI